MRRTKAELDALAIKGMGAMGVFAGSSIVAYLCWCVRENVGTVGGALVAGIALTVALDSVLKIETKGR